MSELISQKATICVVNYKTLDFTKLCLRSIRKFTNYPYEVLVVDNDSNDESLEYLESLPWIRLLQRQDKDGYLRGVHAYSSALDIGLKNCNTEFFVTIHSDTFVLRDDWLTTLIDFFNSDKQTACVGSGKIELTPVWQSFLKKATDFKTIKRNLLREPDPLGMYRHYNRTICAVYRTDILLKENLTFEMWDKEGLTVGKKLYFELVDRGYKTVELPEKKMGQFIIHLAHATQVINPKDFKIRKKTVDKCNSTIKKVMANDLIKQILEDESLDK